MFSELGTRLARMRRALDPGEWMVRLFGLPRQEPPEELEPGLLLVQVDGLGQQAMEDALSEGRMPFLARLLSDEGYRLQTLYSGVPASTPAFQAELFYGVKGAVPAFGYRRDDSGRVVRLWERSAAKQVQEDLAGCERGLLRGGASCVNMFTGGADEAHFCAASFGLDEALARLHPVRLGWAVLLHPLALVRILTLSAKELVLAILDAFQGVFAGRRLMRELGFVLVRALMCVALREYTVAVVRMDAARGLPVMAVNLVGYDEQAHHHGPEAGATRGALRGIDGAIRRMATAAWRSRCRDYQVWIYSDHGQLAAEPFSERHGHPLLHTVTEVARELGIESETRGEEGVPERSLRSRIDLLRKLQRDEPIGQSEDGGILVCGMGSLAHVYFDEPLDEACRRELVRRLVATGEVPMALTLVEGGVVVETPEGSHRLPADGPAAFGEQNRFLPEMVPDVLSLVRHRDAGDVLLSGWAPGHDSVTFTRERGTHAAFTPSELTGFALLPSHALGDREDAPYLRALDLRGEALDLLDRRRRDRPAPPRLLHRRPDTLRVISYNVHGCVGMDGTRSVDRIARVISSLDPDVVALQELDAGRFQQGGPEQAQEVAERLRMHYHFHPAFDLADERFGDAIMSRFPMEVLRLAALPLSEDGRGDREPRGAVWVRLETPVGPLEVLNTHLATSRREARLQADALLGPGWLDEPSDGAPLLICGDLNLLEPKRLKRHPRRPLRDVQVGLTAHRPRPTFPSVLPVKRLDHMLVSPAVRVVQVEVPSSRLIRLASDHLPVVAELRLPGANRDASVRER